MDVRVISRYFLANPKSHFLGKGWMHPFVHLSIVFWLYMVLQCRSRMSSNSQVFYTSGGISLSPAAFLVLIFLSNESSSSYVNCPSLMSNGLLIIFVIGSRVTFGWFPNEFSKCCFHNCIRSSFCRCFYVGINKILIFVIRSMSFWLLLLCIELVSWC